MKKSNKKETSISYADLLEEIILGQLSYKQILARILEESKKEKAVSKWVKAQALAYLNITIFLIKIKYGK